MGIGIDAVRGKPGASSLGIVAAVYPALQLTLASYLNIRNLLGPRLSGNLEAETHGVAVTVLITTVYPSPLPACKRSPLP